MKVLSVSGSPRKNGNTYQMLKRVCNHLAQAGAEIDEVYLHGMKLSPCSACMTCAKKKDRRCHGYQDDGNDLIERTIAADVVLLGSPVYFGSVTGQIKAYMDRVGFVNRVNDQFLTRKIGAAVVAVRRAGALLTFAELNLWFLINGLVVPGSSYWNIARGLKEGEVTQDPEGMQTLDDLAKNILWLAEKIGA
jgi:multimeric flavodoxin WrbA